jgi:hypothetical protein
MISTIKKYGSCVAGAIPAVGVALAAAPVAFAGSIDDMVNTATTSVHDTYGFGIPDATTWMWTNLGQPIMGVGLGTLVDLRWYILGLVALGIAIFFAFRYFGFFKH